jgi:hypothetical protein
MIRAMKTALAVPLTVMTILVTTSQVAGCLEMPILHVDKPSNDGGDASSPSDADAPSSDAPGVCETCLRAPSRPGYGCGDEIAACAADPVCAGTIECGIAKGCFSLGTQAEIVDCGTPCGREAGLDISSPAIELIFAFIACAQDACGPTCRGEDAGPSSDASMR